MWADFEIPAYAVKSDEKGVYRNTWLTMHTSHVYTTASNIKHDNLIALLLLYLCKDMNNGDLSIGLMIPKE